MEQATRLLRHTNLNNRQIGVIKEALRSPSFIVTAAAHADKYRVTAQTAHADLRGLEEEGYVECVRRGRRLEWYPIPELHDRVQRA